MVADLLRWRKAAGPAGKLPFMDASAGGRVWTDLANNPEGREACGWAPAGVPDQVTRDQAVAVLRERGLLAWLEAWLATNRPDLLAEWRGADVVRRRAPQLVAPAADMGWDDAQLDDLFFAAAAVPLKGKA